MDAVRALEDLIAVSSQLEAAVIADSGGLVRASTFEDGRGERVAAEALALLAAADASTAAGGRAELKEVVALAKKGKIRPSPIETRPAEQANAALEDLKAGRVLGRVVLDFESLKV